MKRKLLIGLISACFVATSAFAFIGCDNSQANQSEPTQIEPTQIEQVYAQYVAHAQVEGSEPLSYEEWLATIKGEKGDKGDPGEDGKDGIDGKDGKDGVDGKDGADGKDGVDGKSAYQIWLDNGNEGTEEDFLAWLQGTIISHSFGEWRYREQDEGYCEENMFFRVCSICNVVEWRMGTEADHAWETEIIEPTCQSQGYDLKECEICGKEEKGNYTNIVDHAWAAKYTYNKTSHWIECTTCNEIKDFASHMVDSTDMCTQCGADTNGNIIEGETQDIVPYDGSEVTVTFYHTMGVALQNVLDDYITKFNEMYPNVTIEHYSMGDYAGVRDQITTELVSGCSPSIAYCYPDHVATYREWDAVVTLDDYIMSDEVVMRADGTTETMGYTQAQLNDFFPAFFEEGCVYDDGKMRTLPMMKSTEVLYYNKTAFEENGWTVPTTWAEMGELCAKIKAKYPNDIPFGYDEETNWFITLMEQMGTPFTSFKQGERFLFNNETNRAIVEEARAWYNMGYFTTEEIYGYYTSELFTQTDPNQPKIYMCIGSAAGAPYQCPSLNEDGTYPFEVGVAMLPQVNPSDPKVILQGPSMCLFEKDNPQETAAAWLFAKYLTTNAECQARMSMQRGYMPVIRSAIELPVYADYLASADGNRYLSAAVLKQCIAQMDAYYVSPAFVGATAARDAVGDLFLNCILNSPTDNEMAKQFIKEQFDSAIEKLNKDYDPDRGLNGTYGLSHIVAEWIETGNKTTYNLGDDYFGMTLSADRINVTLNDGKGVMSYDFGQVVTTNITYEVIDDKLIMLCEDAIDLYNNGNAQSRLEFLIEEIDGKTYFVLEASNGYYNFSYFTVQQ